VQRTALALMNCLAPPPPNGAAPASTAASLASGRALCAAVQALFGVALPNTGAALPLVQAALDAMARVGVKVDDIDAAQVVDGTNARAALRVILRLWLAFVGCGSEGETRRAMLQWASTLLGNATPQNLSGLVRDRNGALLMALVDAAITQRGQPTVTRVPAGANAAVVALETAQRVLGVPPLMPTADLLDTASPVDEIAVSLYVTLLWILGAPPNAQKAARFAAARAAVAPPQQAAPANSPQAARAPPGRAQPTPPSANHRAPPPATAPPATTSQRQQDPPPPPPPGAEEEVLEVTVMVINLQGQFEKRMYVIDETSTAGQVQRMIVADVKHPAALAQRCRLFVVKQNAKRVLLDHEYLLTAEAEPEAFLYAPAE
jgi:hypothetical protein